MTTLERLDPGLSNPHARWLALVGRVWYGTAAIAFGLVLASVPTYFLTLGVLTDAERALGKLGFPTALFSPSPAFEFWTDLAIALTSLGGSFLSLGLAAVIGGVDGTVPLGLLYTLGLILVSVGALKSRKLPRWVPAMWLAAVVVGVASALLPSLSLVLQRLGAIMLGLGFVGAGFALWRIYPLRN